MTPLNKIILHNKKIIQRRHKSPLKKHINIQINHCIKLETYSTTHDQLFMEMVQISQILSSGKQGVLTAREHWQNTKSVKCATFPWKVIQSYTF